MSMYTRCPQCETVFRVTPQQLQISSGQVRCGKCQEVFDAFAALSSQLPASAVPAEAPDTRRPGAVGETPAPPRRQAMPARREPARVAAGLDEQQAAQSAPAMPAVLDDVAPLTLPDELFGAPPSGKRRIWLWAFASAGLLVVLLAQAVWFFPGDLAARLPAVRDALEQYCAWTGCKLALPHMPEQLFIEASDLQLLDPAHPSEVLLTATIRNRAPLVQAFPMLDLTLTDQTNQTAARKVFAPEEYLDRSVDRSQGLGANQEVSLRLYLDTGNVRPAGYRLYLFFG
jgi:predicted Zn finger-like uncharacterized protein